MASSLYWPFKFSSKKKSCLAFKKKSENKILVFCHRKECEEKRRTELFRRLNFPECKFTFVNLNSGNHYHLTVQSRLGGGITLSGIFETATTICPICKVYPLNICTHDGGSRGPSSGELGTLFWMTHSIVVKLRGSLAMNWEGWEGSLFFY